jgi:hypothetical protein
MDDLDQVPSFWVAATPRRSTSSSNGIFMRGRYLPLTVLSTVAAFVGCGGSQPQSTAVGHDAGETAPVVAAAENGATAVLAATLRTLTLSNPLADLDANLAHGDHRFIGINGYTCSVPGVPDDDPVVRRFGAGPYCLPGTSDAIEGDRHRTLIKTAEDYARRYNTELLRRIQSGQPINQQFERSRGRIFGGPRRGSMMWINCPRSATSHPRVAQSLDTL